MAIEAIFREGSTRTYTQSIYQHDKGQFLKFVGVELPETFEVHYSNDRENGVSTVVIGSDGIAPIPDAYLATGEYVYAWLYDTHEVTCTKADYDVEEEVLIEEHSDPVTYTKGVSLYEVTIPVIRRPINVVMPVPGIGEYSREYSVNGESLVITEK